MNKKTESPKSLLKISADEAIITAAHRRGGETLMAKSIHQFSTRNIT
jgi:hypothetical protein